MPLPTPEQITSLYLYGQDTVPCSFEDRPSDFKSPIDINTQEFMDGPGRFAVGRQFEVKGFYYAL